MRTERTVGPNARSDPGAPEVWCVVVAGGSGRRFGSAKQFATLGDERVVDRSVRTAAAACDGVVVVLPADVGDEDAVVPRADLVVTGGTTRSESALAGVAAVPSGAGVILVHDAARPLAGVELYERVIGAVRGGALGVVPVVDVTDTIRRVDGTVVDRDLLRSVQTPQGFAAAVIRDALGAGVDATDDAGAVEAAGYAVQMVEGDPQNRKITTVADLEFARMVAAGETLRAVERQERGLDLRIGNGFDIHAFSEDLRRPLVLGGVTFEDEAGLQGHSDADVLAHAVAEALLGAAGLGDLGSHFPDDDDRYHNADSLALLALVVAEVRDAGWEIANVDCSVVAERPKIAPQREAMQHNLSGVVGSPVSVKGRRAEGLGALGRGEGIAAMASAVLISERVRR